MNMDIKTGKLNRRELLSLMGKGSGALALSQMTIACGGGNSVTGPTPNPTPPTPTNINFAARASETFSGSSLGVDYVLEGNGQRHSGRTDREPIQIPTGTYTLKIGMDANSQQSNSALVPSIYESFRIDGSGEFGTDLASYNKLFSSAQHGQINPIFVIEVYRGRRNQGRNQVWRSQPDKYVVSDVGDRLSNYPNPRSNPMISTVMRGFETINQYTNGYLRMPSVDELEIITQDRNEQRGEFYIRLSAGSGGAEGEFIEQNIIKASYAAGSAVNNPDMTVITEMLSAVQGGDSESDGYYENGMRNRQINPMDLVWGDFNYNKRKPGDVMLDQTQSGYGFPIEKRIR